jgi:HEAT repeat protein
MKRFHAAAVIVIVGMGLILTADAQDKKKAKTNPLPPRADEMPKYFKMLKSTSGADRALAAEKIGMRGQVNFMDVEDAIEPLKKCVESDKDNKVRTAAILALGNIHPEAEGTVPLLTDTLKNDKSMDIKLAAVVALGQFAGDAKEALPALRDLATKINDKKAQSFQTVQATIKLITGAKKK